MYAVYFISNIQQTSDNKKYFDIFADAAAYIFTPSPWVHPTRHQRIELKAWLKRTRYGAILTFGPNAAKEIYKSLAQANTENLYQIKIINLQTSEQLDI